MLLLTLYLTLSCGMQGPNYNQGISHNQDKDRRHRVVMKEDRRMKNAMIRARKRASRGTRLSRSKSKVDRKFV